MKKLDIDCIGEMLTCPAQNTGFISRMAEGKRKEREGVRKKGRGRGKAKGK